MLNVHVRINDAATGQPTPCRLRICDQAGRHYAPLGFSPDFPRGRNEDVGGRVAIGNEIWFYIDGWCEIPLPSGMPLVIEAWCGPESPPLRKEVTLAPGQMALRFTVERSRDEAPPGWYSGDVRCHFLSPHSALLEARAEGLSVVQVLAEETTFAAQDGLSYRITPNLLAFSGQTPLLERPGTIVCVNTLNEHPVLGRLALLHCHRPVFPLTFGGTESTDDWSLADWCDQCHRKRGLVVWVDALRPDAVVPGEGWADLVLGRVDAVEVTPETIRPRDWYRVWNAGIFFPLVGSSGKDSNRVCLGSMRTLAHLPPSTPFSLDSWIEALRSGRTVATTGPAIELEVGGRQPGESLDLAEPGREVEISATLRMVQSVSGHLEIVVDGDVIARQAGTEGGTKVRAIRRFDESGWVAARFVGANIRNQFAHSSPVPVSIRGQRRRDAAAAEYIQKQIQKTLDWAMTHGRFEKPRRRDQLLGLLQQARDALNAG
ncbi:MAG: CehA/McbA family metallohydrolase [Gemmataceae bacterium]|nr:CehA/McbA family metallohydrolase [Gemmataceae bacterium]